VKGSIGDTLKGKSQIRLRGFQPAPLLEDVVPSPLRRFGFTDLDLEIAFDGHVANAFDGEFRAAIPSLSMHFPDPRKVLEGLDLQGAFRIEGERMTVSLSHFALDYPRLKAKASLSVDSAPSQVRLKAQGEGIDLLELREVALMTGGEYPLVQEICEHVRAGEITSLVVRSQGTTLADLGSLENLSVKGRFRESRIHIRDPDFKLEGMAGEIALSPGLLEGRDLTGSLGRSSFSGMTVRLDLVKTPYVRHLSGDLSLSLDEIFQRLASLNDFREEMKELKALEGTMVLRVKSLTGPVDKPDKWRFETEGTLKGVRVETSLLPGRLNVSRGSFRANVDSIYLKRVHANLLDAECIVGGRLHGYREDLQAMEWTLRGTVGPEANRWVSEQIELPGEYPAPVRSPGIQAAATQHHLNVRRL